MRKLKSSVKTAVVSTLALTSTAAIIYAVPNMKANDVKSTDIGNKLKLDVEKIDRDTVKVSIDNVQDIPKSIQFSVKLDGNVKLANGESSIKDLIKPQVQARLASNEYQDSSNDILADYTYNQDSNTIDVLITSENSLPKLGNKIEVFELDLKASDKTTKQGGTTYKVVPNDKDEYKYLSVTNKEYSDLGVVSDDETLSLNTAPTITTSKDFIKIVEGEKLELTPQNLGITMEDADKDAVTLEVKDLSQSNKPVITTFSKQTPGLYSLECRAIDSYNEKSEPIEIQVYVDYANVKDLPTITRDGQALQTNITISGGDIFKPLENVKAVDAKGRELEVKVSTDKALELDPENDTTYVLTYTAVDTYGNEAKIQVNLNVIANKAPVISGVKNHTLKVGDSFDPRAGVHVTDEDDDIQLVVDSNVNTNLAGEYRVLYSATDSKGKTTRVQSIVKVNPKMSSINHVPVIYANDTTIKLGDAFNPLSIVTAYDEEDKDLTQSVEVVKNNVDTKKEGNYTVTYRVKDKNGATATKTITVTVVKGVTLASEIKISNKFNNLYLGASKEINAAVNKEADIKDIKWSVSDTNILNLEAKGNTAKVTAKGEGKVVITATTTDGSNLSDSFEVTVQDFKKDDVIPDVIANIIDTNIVTPVSGQGDLNSPVELEVKDVKSEDFTNFVKDLKKGNSKIVDTIETKEFTVYKIKLTKYRLFARNTEYYVELKIDNSLANASKYKEIVVNTLKVEEDNNNSNGGNTSGGNGSTNNGGNTSGGSGSTNNGGNTSGGNGSTNNGGNTSGGSGSTNNGGNTSGGNGSTNNGGNTSGGSGSTNNGGNTSGGNGSTNNSGNTSNESTTTNEVENETINDQLDEIATSDEITNETTEESKDNLEETTTTASQVEAEESKNGNNIIAYIGVGIAAIAGVLFAKGKKDE